jgi:hypothetical protein
MYLVGIWNEARTRLGVVAKKQIPDPVWNKIAFIQLVARKYLHRGIPVLYDNITLLLY